MSTNIGIGLTGNFLKTVNPIVLNSYQVITETEDISNVADFTEFLESESLTNKILRVIQSLDTHDSTEDIDQDANPLDNIIRAEIIDLLNYRKISKVKIQEAFAFLASGQDPFINFTMDENLIILNQARQLEYISEEIFQQFLTTGTTNLFFDYPETYKKVLDFQLNLPNNIPTIDELKIAGIVDFIITTVKENPDTIIDESLVQQFTETYINEILLTSEFIGYDNCSKILADPEHILNIIGKTGFANFAIRMMPYLNFITKDKINIIENYIPAQYLNIVDIFSESQIRLMIDKELDIKNTILKTLSLTEVQNLFNNLITTFKDDFISSFTEERLKDLIAASITALYPVRTNTEIYQDLCIEYNINVANIDIDAIEAKLQTYYL